MKMTVDNKIRAYLNRIGFTGEPRLDFETLHRLQKYHLQSVPYENLDIMRNVPLALDPEGIFEKIVTRRRGGYCFELNGLFAWLLRSLGFGVTDYMARFLRDETSIPMRRHRVLRVACEGTDYLCDVGVGGVVPRRPVPLALGVINEQNGEKYKLVHDSFYRNVLYEWKNDEWRRIYGFTEEEQLDLDYIMPSYYCENHPDSYFRRFDMVHIFTDNGRKSVAGREIKIFTPSGVELIEPSDEKDYAELLEIHFGIRI